MKLSRLMVATSLPCVVALAHADDVSVRMLSAGQPVEHAAVMLVPTDPPILPPPGTAIMDQRSKQFSPHVLSVSTGTRVQFPNSDDIRHQVYSFSPAKRFELPLYHGADAPPVTFDKPGIVVLGCNIHDNMIGYILVADTPWHTVTNAAGEARLSAPPGRYTLEVWHPLEQAPVASRALHLNGEPVTLTLDLGPLKPDPRNGPSMVDNPFRRRAFDAK